MNRGKKHRLRVASEYVATSPQQPATRWVTIGRGELDLKLVTWMIVLLGLFVVVLSLRYSSQVSALPIVYRERANIAIAQKDPVRACSLLDHALRIDPNDHNTRVLRAIVSDNLVDREPLATRFKAMNEARMELAKAIRVASNSRDRNDLRERLIVRLLQMGGAWSLSAEEEISRLDFAIGNPQAHKWLAIANLEQRLHLLRSAEIQNAGGQHAQDWQKLSSSPLELIVETALDGNEGDLEIIERYLAYVATERFRELQDADAILARQKLLDRCKVSLQREVNPRGLYIRHRYSSTLNEAGVEPDTLTRFAEQITPQKPLHHPQSSQNPRDQVDQNCEDWWSFRLLLSLCDDLADIPAEVRLGWFEKLTELSWSDVPDMLVELAHVGHGNLLSEMNQPEEAVATWEKGLQLDSNSLSLQEARAKFYLGQLPSSAECNDAMREWKRCIDLSFDNAKNNGGRVAGQTRTETDSYALAFNAASAWRYRFAEAVLLKSQGNTESAVNALEAALADRKRASRIDVQNATRLLSDWYRNLHQHDSSALWLENLLTDAPNEGQVHLEIATAWSLAGNHRKAVFHSSKAVDAKDPISVVQHLRFVDLEIRSRPNSDQDWNFFRTQIDSARKLLDQVRHKTAEENRSLKEGELRHAESELEFLTITTPPLGFTCQQHAATPEFSALLVKLASSQSEDLKLQQMIARKMIDHDLLEEAKSVINTLRNQAKAEDADPSGIIVEYDYHTSDRTAALERILKETGKPGYSNQREADTNQLVNAIRIGQNDHPRNAYDQIKNHIPMDAHPRVLFEMGHLARHAYGSSELSVWEHLLRQRGDQARTWRQLLSAIRLLDDLRDRPPSSQQDSRIIDALKLLSEVTDARPAWGEAISRRAWIDVIVAGDAENRLATKSALQTAVAGLRRGIAAGDERIETQYLLWKLLVILGDHKNAAIELELLSNYAQLDPYSPLRLRSLVNLGQHNDALDLARRSIANDPDEPIRHFWLAKVALAILRHHPQRSEILLQEADSAVQRGKTLASLPLQKNSTRNESLAQFMAEVELELAGELKSVDRLSSFLASINQRKLPSVVVHRLTKDCLTKLGRDGEAIEQLKRVIELDPRPEDWINLAALHARQGQHSKEFDALRTASQNFPDAPACARLYARALAKHAAEQPSFWQEIESLLCQRSSSRSKDLLLYADILLEHGNKKQASDARKILRKLVSRKLASSNQAARRLLKILQSEYSASNQLDTRIQQTLKLEIAELHQYLTSMDRPLVNDLYEYGRFLSSSSDASDQKQLQNIIKGLLKNPSGFVASLTLSIRDWKKTDRDKGVETLANWLRKLDEQKVVGKSVSETDLISTVMMTMQQLNQSETAIRTFTSRCANGDNSPSAFSRVLLSIGLHQQCRDFLSHLDQTHWPNEALAEVLFDCIQAADLGAAPLSESEIDLLKIVATRPSSTAELRARAATACFVAKLYRESEQILTQLVVENPDRANWLNNLAYIQLQSPGESEETLQLINRAILMEPNNPRFLDTKALILLKMGRYTDALKLLQRVCKLNPTRKYQFHLAGAQLACGQTPTALTPNELAQLDNLDLCKFEDAMLAGLGKHPTGF